MLRIDEENVTESANGDLMIKKSDHPDFMAGQKVLFANGVFNLKPAGAANWKLENAAASGIRSNIADPLGITAENFAERAASLSPMQRITYARKFGIDQ
jgi:hypothetical protein